ncbi:DUF2530 domain-containing protein [Paraoerskovia sediminicola]|uniref:DUF2530 domain-containing protein n=1 Tax=Paraoerskovia sediminicola TaxID=1138587 RepID=A0ABN6XCV2_9CELL|nr:DUF2530 domain-containing protein [Paraoerskovia sediminicola]BDZ42666.1 DUF2530 domain-containing protein [Paraoerskovia sediminicola]
MPSHVHLVLRPETRRPAPEPLRVDLRPILLVGIAVFVVAGIVCGLLMILDVTALRHVLICVAGVSLGLVGLVWEKKHRADYRGV